MNVNIHVSWHMIRLTGFNVSEEFAASIITAESYVRKEILRYTSIGKREERGLREGPTGGGGPSKGRAKCLRGKKRQEKNFKR
jgi:hypothetical protein